jgi:hypothetical protein
MFAALLSLEKRLTDGIPHVLMEAGKVLLRAANPKDRLDSGWDSHARIMPK